ncbi:MAG: thioredoxin family protein [Chitinophagales bacterium]
MQVITPQILEQALSFDAYLQLTKDIVEEKIAREGRYVPDNTFRYTRSNLERMQKVLDQMTLSQKLYNLLSDLEEEWVWVVLTEPWCGDASWGVPALYIISTATDKVDFRILLRDSNPEVMKAYQTEGSDSIPKLVCLRKSDFKELGSWGPRPKQLQQIVMEGLNQPDFNYRDSVRSIHAWYEEDMAKSIQEELVDLIKDWSKV